MLADEHREYQKQGVRLHLSETSTPHIQVIQEVTDKVKVARTDVLLGSFPQQGPPSE